MRGRISKTTLAQSRTFIHTVLRDPQHAPERIVLVACTQLGASSERWAHEMLAGHPDATREQLADDRRRLTSRLAMIDGAIAGTPFFVALLPGYLDFLWQEAAMVFRIAALYGHDPSDLRVAAELLALRGIHASVEDAQASLEHVRATPVPGKPEHRRPLRTWFYSVWMLGVLGGFLSPPKERGPAARHGKVFGFVAAIVSAGMWVLTFVLPLTFMIMMGWGCESNARHLGLRAQAFYAGGATSIREAIEAGEQRRPRPGHTRRQLLRSAALFLSAALPIGFIAYANHVRNAHGVNTLTALGGLVALSVVIAAAVIARRT